MVAGIAGSALLAYVFARATLGGLGKPAQARDTA